MSLCSSPRAHAHRLLLIAVAALIVGFGVNASRASAEGAACTAGGYGHLCLWFAGGAQGPMWEFSSTGAWRYVGAAANDEAGSYWNYRNVWVTWVAKNWPNDATQACIPNDWSAWSSGSAMGVWPNNNSSGYHTVSSYELSTSRTACPFGTEFLANVPLNTWGGGPGP
jgi:hypothetical protein